MNAVLSAKFKKAGNEARKKPAAGAYFSSSAPPFGAQVFKVKVALAIGDFEPEKTRKEVIVSSVHDLRECSLALRSFTEEKFTHQAESLPRLDCEILGLSQNRSRHLVQRFRVAGLTNCDYFEEGE